MSYRTCSVPNCVTDMSDQYLRKGYCERHYYSWRKYGDPVSIEERRNKNRKRNRPKTRKPIEPCQHCGNDYEVKSPGAKYCSPFCRSWSAFLGPGQSKHCNECGDPMMASRSSFPGPGRCHDCTKHSASGFDKGCRCEVCIAAKRQANMAYKARVKAEHGVSPSTLMKRRYRERTGKRYPVDASWDWIPVKLRYELYERDKWLCHLCDEPVDREAHYNDDFAPSLDHLLPRSKGGSDDASNLKTAHRICNSIRQDSDLAVMEVV